MITAPEQVGLKVLEFWTVREEHQSRTVHDVLGRKDPVVFKGPVFPTEGRVTLGINTNEDWQRFEALRQGAVVVELADLERGGVRIVRLTEPVQKHADEEEDGRFVTHSVTCRWVDVSKTVAKAPRA